MHFNHHSVGYTKGRNSSLQVLLSAANTLGYDKDVT
jgi:hypothetical protein